MKNSFHQNTQILGLLGHPIKQSYSPFIHNITFTLLGMDYIYLPFDVPAANLKNALKGINALGIKGFNVTIPHKESLVAFLSNVSEEASIVGSVNTVVNDMGKLVGYNTDVHGVYESLAPYKDDILGKEVSVIGSGGAARAVIYSLIRHFKPSSINIINRTEQRAESLKNYFMTKMKFEEFKTFELFPPDIIDTLRASKLIINASSVGMFPDVEDSPINLQNAFTKEQIVFDLVYNPPKTKLLELAEAEGAIVLNGLNMLVHQAAKAFELWTGQQMPIDEIKQSLLQYIQE